jgi:hypothetical protein
LNARLDSTAAPRKENFSTRFALEDGFPCAGLDELRSLEYSHRCVVQLIRDSADLQNGRESKELLNG